MEYRFLRGETWEIVQPEEWQWQVEYQDGTTQKQFCDEEGIFHQFSEIDQRKLKVFKMISPNHPQSFILLFDPNRMKLIHYYKRVAINIGTEDEKHYTAYCFGYETKYLGRTNKVNLMIIPSGEIIICEDVNKIELN